MREIDEIIIHATATNPSWMADKPVKDVVAEIRRWHVDERKWSDIGYHYVIHRDGSLGKGRPVEKSGAHVGGRNKTTIGVSLVGGRGGIADGEFHDNFTAPQEASLRQLIQQLKEEHPTITNVSGHNEYASKACPCFSVKEWLTVSKM
jgi:N-acetyl-anhydromuramyl-L-alanine amidase AmpD